jgi:hypothetical protein
MCRMPPTIQSLSEIERTKAAEFAQGIAVTTLSRIWQMLLKGIPETEAPRVRPVLPKWC